MTKSRGILKTRAHWRDEVEVLMLRQHYPNVPTQWLADVFGFTLSKVYQKARKLGLTKSAEYLASELSCRLRRGDEVGKAYRFQKGIVPANKGLRRPGWTAGNMASTQFKKGQMPHTWMPVGSYRVNKSWGGREGEPQGCLEFKFGDEPGPYTNRWKAVHRMVWEQANGPVPVGHVIAFTPGRKSLKLEEITLDTLECITRSENARRNTRGFCGELADIHRARGRLTKAINKRAKQQKGEAP